MTVLADLSDDELFSRARRWRSEAMRGSLHARGHAHEHEVELRRRSARTMPVRVPAEAPQRPPKRSLLQFWRS
jgi:hypothetical protein